MRELRLGWLGWLKLIGLSFAQLCVAKSCSEYPGCRWETIGRSWERAGYGFLSAFLCEAVPERAGDFYASVKLARQRRGLALDENDLWVAATALAMGATLVSRDCDFSGINDLPVVALA